MRRTPITERGLRQYDKLTPVRAILDAWTVPGNNPAAHAEAQRIVRAAMPLLGRALDRAARYANRGRQS